MKYLSKLILSLMVASIIMAGCNTKELQNLNTAPQAVKTINLNFLFTPAQLATASGGGAGDNRFIDWRTNIGMCSYAIQQLANSGGGIAPGDKYTDNFETSEAPWNFMYGFDILQCTEIIFQTSAEGYDAGNKVNLAQAARVLRAFLFGRLTDFYGSVPYFDAESVHNQPPGQGVFFPHYDKQKDVYTAILKELDEACAAFDASLPDDGFSSADLFYGGNIAQWKRFGYSVMLRHAMKVSGGNVDGGPGGDIAMANTYVAKAIAGGTFTSNADNVWVAMATGPAQWTNQNGISRAFYPGDGGQPTFMNAKLITYLKGPDSTIVTDDDPRLMMLCGGIGNWYIDSGESKWTPLIVGTDTLGDDPLLQHGMPSGADDARIKAYEHYTGTGTVNQDNTYSKINYKLLDLDDPYLLMNYGEVELLIAEACERSIGGLTPGSAAVHYNNGVKASLEMYTPYYSAQDKKDGITVFDVTPAAEAAYMAQPNVVYKTGTDGLKQIAEQLWVNHFMDWYEAWSDWRRTELPHLDAVVYTGNVTTGKIPQRLKYPNLEVAGNPNYSAGATLPNVYQTKLWFAGGAE